MNARWWTIRGALGVTHGGDLYRIEGEEWLGSIEDGATSYEIEAHEWPAFTALQWLWEHVDDAGDLRREQARGFTEGLKRS